MFTISRLFSKKDDINDQNQYIKVASLIEEGSILDRRSLSNVRRNSMNRRMRLRDSFSGEEKRNDSDRRFSISRREADSVDKDAEIIEKKIEKKTVELSPKTKIVKIPETKKNDSLSEVEVLIRDQVEIMTCMNDLSIKAKSSEFEGIEEKIRKISFKLKSIKCEEEKLLYLSFDRKEKIQCNNSEQSVTEVLEYIHDVSDKALEFLDRYHSGVTGANVGFFLLDMNIVQKELSNILDKKKNNLYPMYENV